MRQKNKRQQRNKQIQAKRQQMCKEDLQNFNSKRTIPDLMSEQQFLQTETPSSCFQDQICEETAYFYKIESGIVNSNISLIENANTNCESEEKDNYQQMNKKSDLHQTFNTKMNRLKDPPHLEMEYQQKHLKISEWNSENIIVKLKDTEDINHFRSMEMNPEIFSHKLEKPQQMRVRYDVQDIQVIQFKEVHRICKADMKIALNKEKVQEIEGKKDIRVGRNEKGDIVISDEMRTISRDHAVFTYQPSLNQWIIQDLESANGSYLISDEILLKNGIQLLIGTFLCQVESDNWQLNALDNQTGDDDDIAVNFRLECSNLVDDSVDTFYLDIQVSKTHPFKIGKAHQMEFQIDTFVSDLHCLVCLSKTGQVIVHNINHIYDQVGVKIQPQTQYPLQKISFIKFGLLKKYEVQLSTKQILTNSFKQQISQRSSEVKYDSISSVDSCLTCDQPSGKLFYLKPCNHRVLCIQCIAISQDSKCPSCNVKFIDFNPD